MARRRRLTANAEARDELLAATLWYDAQRDGLGLQLLGAVRECLERIVEGPGVGSIVPGTPAELQARRVQVHRFPYAVVYIDMEDEVRVLAFAHGHMGFFVVLRAESGARYTGDRA